MKTANHPRTIAASEGTLDRQTHRNWTVVRDHTVSAKERSDFERQVAALELANRTKDAWLIAQSQKLREPISSMASMLGLMELAHQLALVRPLHQMPSEFDEAAFKHLRWNFERLLRFFNELADLTGETRVKIGKEERPVEKNGTEPFRVLGTRV